MASVGVPDNTPVFASMVMPLPVRPVTENVGEPLAVKVKLYGCPAVTDPVGLPLVNTGFAATSSVSTTESVL